MLYIQQCAAFVLQNMMYCELWRTRQPLTEGLTLQMCAVGFPLPARLSAAPVGTPKEFFGNFLVAFKG